MAVRGFSFAKIGWITAIPSFDLRAREAMTDRRPLLRAIFDAAVAAAHPDVVLARHLRPVPKGRVICLAAGKGAAAMAAAAERHYLDALELDPSRLSGIATTRHGHGGVGNRAQERASVGHRVTKVERDMRPVIHPIGAKENPRGSLGFRFGA